MMKIKSKKESLALRNKTQGFVTKFHVKGIFELYNHFIICIFLFIDKIIF